MHIAPCTEQHLDAAANLFNQYRLFYEQPSDPGGCHQFIKDNLETGRSRVYLLFDDDGTAVGFSQLYPMYCSIAMKPTYYLSDLFISSASRRQGYARCLMSYLTEVFKAEGVYRLTLDTARTNQPAQRLYESLAYERENLYVTFHRMLGAG